MISVLSHISTGLLLAAAVAGQTSSVTATSSAASSSSTASTSSTVSDSQYWHERYHGLLSMAAYGDYETLCPLVFTEATLLQSFPDSTEEPWTVLEKWGPTASGLSGFSVQIPEMDKVVMVFGGLYIADWEQLDSTPTNLAEAFSLTCTNCTGHTGALNAYLEAREATNNWAIVAEAVNATGHQWSITGHGFGGMVAQLAALDLGWAGKSHWLHSHGSPRTMNLASANLIASLYGGEASQRTVANNDSVVTIIPESDDYTFAGQGFHVYGTNATYGQNYQVCESWNPDDPNCAGGSTYMDNYFYYTPIGTCGSQYSANLTQENKVISSLSKAYYATATVTQAITTVGALPNATTALSSTATLLTNSSTMVASATNSSTFITSTATVPIATTSSVASVASVTEAVAAATSSVAASSAEKRVAVTGAALGFVGLAFALLV